MFDKIFKKKNADIKPAILKSGLFDEVFYTKKYKDAASSRKTAIDHYLSIGIDEDRKPNSTFDPSWYKEYYKDVKLDAGYSIIHYILFGKNENRFINIDEKNNYDLLQESGLFNEKFYQNYYEELKNKPDDFDFLLHFICVGIKNKKEPNSIFDSLWYMQEYISNSTEPPIIHYLKYGKKKNYFVNADENNYYHDVLNSGLFDESFYKKNNEDLSEQDDEFDLLLHFIQSGMYENRSPNSNFDASWYEKQYFNTEEDHDTSIIDFIKVGNKKNRFINANEKDNYNKLSNSGLFDKEFYKKNSYDLIKVDDNFDFLLHYVRFGADSGKNPNTTFDSDWYQKYYEDVQSSFDLAIIHYIEYGQNENRFINKNECNNYKKLIESGLFDIEFYKKKYIELQNKQDRYDLVLDCVRFGEKEGREPNPTFDSCWYKSHYLDSEQIEILPIIDYIITGKKTGKLVNKYEKNVYEQLKKSDLFTKEFYKIDDVHFILHFIRLGLNEQRESGAIFNQNWEEEYYKSVIHKFTRIPFSFVLNFDQDSYLMVNHDIRQEVQKGHIYNALEHFMFFGYDEVRDGKRRIGGEFPFMNEKDYKNYLDTSSEIKLFSKDGVSTSAFEYFILYGYVEFQTHIRMLTGSYPFELTKTLENLLKIDFDEEAYLQENEDIKIAILEGRYESAWSHFLLEGVFEIKKGIRSLHPRISCLSEVEYVYFFKDIFEPLKSGEMISPYEHFLLHGSKEIISGDRKIPKNSRYNYKEVDLTKVIIDEIKSFKSQPLISIIMPVFNVDAKWLDFAIQSLKKQWYKNWELCIADDKSTKNDTLKYLKSINDKQIKIVFLEKNLNISAASNEALKLTLGEYIGLMDNDDELTPDALYEVVKSINETGAEFIYSDEDKLDMNGNYCEPHFKPDYAPDMLLSQNYISHLSVMKKSLIDKVGGFNAGLEGSQDYDLYLRVLEHTTQIYHIQKVLYHWRKIHGSTAMVFSDKSYAQQAGIIALENAYKRRNISAVAKNGKYPGTYRTKYDIVGEPLVSVVIPFKDKPELLDMCINSILDKSTYKNYEVIGVSNNSLEQDTFKMINTLKKKDSRVSFYEYNVPFNYSKINNYAVYNYAKGEHVVLLNNDIEIITKDWIESMLEFSQKKEIGAVGAKLYYPDGTIQHAGVIIGIGGVAGHSHKYFSKNNPGYFSRIDITQNMSAVTAACLMVKKSLFEELQGLNEKDLTIAFNDVDFCLRIQEKGYRNIYTPYCEAYHHESISRGEEDNPQKVKRFNKEVDYMKEKYKYILKHGDPCYNSNLTLKNENFDLK